MPFLVPISRLGDHDNQAKKKLKNCLPDYQYWMVDGKKRRAPCFIRRVVRSLKEGYQGRRRAASQTDLLHRINGLNHFWGSASLNLGFVQGTSHGELRCESDLDGYPPCCDHHQLDLSQQEKKMINAAAMAAGPLLTLPVTLPKSAAHCCSSVPGPLQSTTTSSRRPRRRAGALLSARKSLPSTSGTH